MTITNHSLFSCGYELDRENHSWGELRDSNGLGTTAMVRRLQEDGFLFLRGFLDTDLIRAVRHTFLRRLQAEGLLDPSHHFTEGILKPELKVAFRSDLAVDNAELQRAIYGPELLGLYEKLFGEAVRHYDYTWVRAVGPGGKGTPPHCDIVYMGRGTFDLLTAWVPFGTVPWDVGGLLILEGSHLQKERLKSYLSRDVDEYCINGRHAKDIESGKKQWEWAGWLTNNPVSLREKMGGRWLSAEFEMGDVLTFGMGLIHGSLANQSNQIRLSTDSRYQRASEPIDGRWIGSNPSGHGLAGKRGRIC